MMSGKPLVWLHSEIKTPPFSRAARVEAGTLLRRLQNGETIDMPASRPMPDVGKRCHELRVDDGDVTFRIIYYIAPDAVVILDVLQKKTRSTPRHVIDVARRRLRLYNRLAGEE